MNYLQRRSGSVAAWLGALLWPSKVAASDWSYEAAILRILRENEAIDLNHLVEIVAAEAVRNESGAGAWAADVGFWGPALCRRATVDVIRRMLGHSLVLEASGEGPGFLVPVAAG